MTAPVVETETIAPPTIGQTADVDTTQTETPPGDGRGKSPGADAAKYRVQRNEAREALAAANARVEAFQRAEVARLAGDLAAPGDLFDVGQVTLADLLTEAGDVDNAAVAEAVAALIEQRPGLALNPRIGATDPTQGQVGGRVKRQPSFGDLLSG